MALASVLADHTYHKKLPYKLSKSKDVYLGATKRQLSSRKTTDGHLLTVLNKKKVPKRNKYIREKEHEKAELDSEAQIKPEITDIQVPPGDTFMSLMNKQLLEPTHKWEVYDQVVAIVTAATDPSARTDHNCSGAGDKSKDKSDTVTNEQTQGDSAGGSETELTRSEESKSPSVPSKKIKFVDVSGINCEFNMPENTELYSVSVPEW